MDKFEIIKPNHLDAASLARKIVINEIDQPAKIEFKEPKVKDLGMHQVFDALCSELVQVEKKIKEWTDRKTKLKNKIKLMEKAINL